MSAFPILLPEPTLPPAVASFGEVVAKIRAVPPSDLVPSLQRELLALIAEATGAKRVTLFGVVRGRGTEQCLVSVAGTGISENNAIRLPINYGSVAGYVAKQKTVVNIVDVRDDRELMSIDSVLQFNPEVDRRTGHVTRQVLCAPVLAQDRKQLLGVLQCLNRDGQEGFPSAFESGIRDLTRAIGEQIMVARLGVNAAALGPYQELVTAGYLTAEDFATANLTAQNTRLHPEDVLERDLKIPVATIGRALANYYGVDYEPFRPARIVPEPELLASLKKDFVLRSQWAPISLRGETVYVVCRDPNRAEVRSVARSVFEGRQVALLVTTYREFLATVNQLFASVGSVEQKNGVDGETKDAISLVNQMILDAHRLGASDVHFEPYGNEVVDVRLRRDGIMHPYATIPGELRAEVVNRIKIMAGMDTSERRKPQDGKIQFGEYSHLNIELRVYVMPTVGDVENVVLRLVSIGGLRDLNDLGITAENLARIKTETAKPYGLVLVTGPTGSGKTTTLHAMLKPLNTPDRKIWTVEEPVEIQQRGLCQVSVNVQAGRTFAATMRSFLRGDPDIIVVGECRDAETANTAVEGALTGHLVMTTLHTNSAPEAVARLVEMGVDPFNFADAALAVLGQRLLRRLCVKCRTGYLADVSEVRKLAEEYCLPLGMLKESDCATAPTVEDVLAAWQDEFRGVGGRLTLYRATGCPDCLQTGYRGRIGVQELMVVSDHLKELIQGRVNVKTLYGAAIAGGMKTLRQDAIRKVLSGDTDPAEVHRVVVT